MCDPQVKRHWPAGHASPAIRSGVPDPNGIACSDLIERLSQGRDLRLRVPATALARYIAAMTDGLTLNYLVLGDESAWADILDTVIAHVAGLVQDDER